MTSIYDTQKAKGYRCQKCLLPLAPMLYVSNDGVPVCCFDRGPVGLTSFKCPGCGVELQAQHVHGDSRPMMIQNSRGEPKP